jgi:hypothetical protein
MTYVGILVMTMLFAAIPWIFLAVPLAAKDFNNRSLYLLAGSGLILDLWWGTPLGLTALFLLILTVALRAALHRWPFDPKVFVVIAMVVCLILVEAYLVFV